ncbi:hypothetical protein ANCCAN_03766 [Ancylostoma caninum]|uniref:Serpentine receptor class gamma n=1 Tax=Ancylostoma caninum TaxID=29170 RepID=A0A368H0M3_ANCCA|nr:hypothetical protein ANCCAN_03766 [Ancylostoma caninum]
MKEVEMYNTVLLRVAEVAVILVTILLNILLIAAVSTPRCRYTTAFFKLIRILSMVLLIHSVVSMIFKTLPSLFDIQFHFQNKISLWMDLFTRYFAILLIFILALNRFSVLIVRRLDELFFSGLKYIWLPCTAFTVSAIMTAMVVNLCEMERAYIDWLGFVDSTGKPEFYVVFIVSFTLLNIADFNKNDLYFIISLYNVLSAIPELLIPVFVLFGTKGMLSSLVAFCTKEKTSVMQMKPTSTRTGTG